MCYQRRVDLASAYTTIGHRGLAICNPCDAAQLDAAIGLCAPPRGGFALDIGCGKGELLLRIAELTGCRGVGIDRNPEFIAEARAGASRRCPELVEFVHADAAVHHFAPDAHDLGAVMGASHSLGGTGPALATLRRTVRRGGYVLFGEGFWRRPPSDEELAVLGAARDAAGTLGELVAAVEHAGLTPLDVAIASEASFDRYEWAHHRNVEAYARERPDDPAAQSLWKRRRSWRDAYLHAGRAALGFALVVASKL